MEALEVGHIARHMEVEDLAVARPPDLVGARDAVLNEETARRTLARVDDILTGTDFGDLDGQVPERRLLLVGDREDAVQFADEECGVARRHSLLLWEEVQGARCGPDRT